MTEKEGTTIPGCIKKWRIIAKGEKCAMRKAPVLKSHLGFSDERQSKTSMVLSLLQDFHGFKMESRTTCDSQLIWTWSRMSMKRDKYAVRIFLSLKEK